MNLDELDEADVESSGVVSVRAALYSVQESSKAHLPVVHALVMRTLTRAAAFLIMQCLNFSRIAKDMAPLAALLDGVCARQDNAAVDDALVTAWRSGST